MLAEEARQVPSRRPPLRRTRSGCGLGHQRADRTSTAGPNGTADAATDHRRGRDARARHRDERAAIRPGCTCQLPGHVIFRLVICLGARDSRGVYRVGPAGFRSMPGRFRAAPRPATAAAPRGSGRPRGTPVTPASRSPVRVRPLGEGPVRGRRVYHPSNRSPSSGNCAMHRPERRGAAHGCGSRQKLAGAGVRP